MHQVSRGVVLAVLALSLASLAGGTVQGRQGCVTGFIPSTLSLPAAGTSSANPATVAVLTASADCQWFFDRSVLPDGTIINGIPTWLGLPSPPAATGPATVAFFVMPNRDSTPRSLTLYAGSQPLPVTQAGDPCPLTLSGPTPTTVPANGGTASFTVSTSGSSCSYSVQPGDGVTIISGGSGNAFPATVTFSVAPNTSSFQTTRQVSVSTTGTFGPWAWGVSVTQNGTPVATDAPRGYSFAVHRPASGPEYASPPESLRITNTEDPTASWSATTSEPWLVVSPSSGTSPGTATISLNPAAVAVLTRGGYAGTITLFSSIAPSTPQFVPIYLHITDATSITSAPSGVVDVPVNGAAGLAGAVPVSGWATDDVGVARVQIFRNAVAGEVPAEVYVGDGTRVRGARPDVVARFNTPGATSAGWGLMVLSNVLPSGGNGTFTFSAYADDVEGHRSLLGRKTVTFDNTRSIKPFGTIDRPGQGATISGIYSNQGWILAQPGQVIPLDGSTIRLFIDGVEQSNVAWYGHARPDVQALFPFPTYANANGPALQFTLDTTAFPDGLHTIVWVVRDDVGTIEGIGSRYITIQNGAASQVMPPAAPEARSAAEVQALPQASALVWERRGVDDGPWSLRFHSRELRAARGERIEVALDTWWWAKACGPWAAYLITGDVAGPLPIGAALDAEAGILRWQPPIEFAGTHDFVFVRRSCTGRDERFSLRVVVGRH